MNNKRRFLAARETNESRVNNNNLPFAANSELPVNMMYLVPTRVQRVGFLISESSQNARELNHFAQSESNMLTTAVANSIISSSQSSGRHILAGHVLTESEAEDIHINPLYTPDARVTQRNRFITYLSTLPIPINFVSPQEVLVTGEPVIMRNIDEECVNLYGRATYYAAPPIIKTKSKEHVTDMALTQAMESCDNCKEEQEEETHSSQFASPQEPECIQKADAENVIAQSTYYAESNVFICYSMDDDNDGDNVSTQSILTTDAKEEKHMCTENIV